MNNNLEDKIISMSDGNPGAINFLMKLVETDIGIGLTVIKQLDGYNVRGAKLYMLWNDVCYRNLKNVFKVMDEIEIGVITLTELDENLSKVRAKPYHKEVV